MSLPVEKWSKSSLIKCLERNYAMSLKRLVTDDSISMEEKKRRGDQMLKMFHSIYQPIFNYGVTTKKM